MEAKGSYGQSRAVKDSQAQSEVVKVIQILVKGSQGHLRAANCNNDSKGQSREVKYR